MILRWLNSREARDCRPVVFLDRDGTVTHYCGFVTRPEEIELDPGAAEALRVLAEGGFCRVVVSNQSAVGRGMLTEEGLATLNGELLRQLEADGATLDAIYWCPERPICDNETVIESPDRKPGPGMLLAAARDLKLDLSRSWMVGDRISDVLAGINAGCRGSICVQSGYQYPNGVPQIDRAYFTVADLKEAVELILSQEAADCGAQVGTSVAASPPLQGRSPRGA